MTVSTTPTAQELFPTNPTAQELLPRNAEWERKIVAADPRYFERLAAVEQEPKVLWIGCADSRVPETTVCNCTLGDIFTHRNIANPSQIGDTSIDLPEATCLIQISSRFGSRRQEARRLRRVLRAKRQNDDRFNAFFYSSRRTRGKWRSARGGSSSSSTRGMRSKVITRIDGLEATDGLVYRTRDEQDQLLQTVLRVGEREVDASGDMPEGRTPVRQNAPASRMVAGMRATSSLRGAKERAGAKKGRR
ncbi:carbonic anhydrase [Mycena maculata]|uniref:Carbonic anhydrase n=1 Tax=Mycena maculata TaxID=230809 RepID=A0AAD7K0W7_9AGAR|nr:carbonic anhydrase [Mycena maculata]